MGLFSKSENLKLEQLELQLKEANADNNALRSEIEDYRKTISSFAFQKESWIAEKDDIIKQHNAILKNANDNHNNEVALLKQAMIDLENSVNAKVNENLSKLGVNVFLPEPIKN